MSDRGLRFSALGEAMVALDRLSQAQALASATAWTWAQTLAHCAQSIEYSMTGYPQAQSALFQRTLGTVAFQVFAWRGRMTHNLGEPIPGAPSLADGLEADAARLRLQSAVAAFERWQSPVQPHFAYGPLDKAAFAHAHAMHLANHFSAFGPKA